MTPFSPAALVAMLLTFYPVVSGASLARARVERPEYFAGGALGGSHGDKLVLPDASCWDCIFASGTGDPSLMRWQCVPCGAGAPGDALFPLEPGPLATIDGDAIPPTNLSPDFTSFVADRLRELGASDPLLADAASTVASAGTGGPFDDAVSGPIDEADGAVDAHDAAFAAATPDSELAATTGSGGTIDGGAGDAEFTAPPYVAPSYPGNAPAEHEPGPGDPYTDASGVDHPGG